MVQKEALDHLDDQVNQDTPHLRDQLDHMDHQVHPNR